MLSISQRLRHAFRSSARRACRLRLPQRRSVHRERLGHPLLDELGAILRLLDLFEQFARGLLRSRRLGHLGIVVDADLQDQLEVCCRLLDLTKPPVCERSPVKRLGVFGEQLEDLSSTCTYGDASATRAWSRCEGESG